jgi:hypothetical protein
MCNPRFVRVIDPEAMPFEIQHGLLVPTAVGLIDVMLENDGFVHEEEFGQPEESVFADMLEDDGFIPDNHEEEEEFGQPEELVFTDDEMERMWNVYRGIERPNDANDWRACWEYCTQSLYYVTGLTYEFEEWQTAWTDKDELL